MTSPRAPEQYSGDAQCVYVVPRHRDAGLGLRPLAAVLEHAAELGLERVTVHSSPEAVPVRRSLSTPAGFASSPRLIQIHPSTVEAHQ